MLKIDFSQSQDYEPLPAGVYDVVVVETEVKMKDGGDYPYISWQLSVQTEGFVNRRLWLNTSCAPQAAWKLRETLIALGEAEEAFKGADVEVDPEAFVGKAAKAVVVLDTYQGKPTNRVDDLIRAEQPEGPQVR